MIKSLLLLLLISCGVEPSGTTGSKGIELETSEFYKYINLFEAISPESNKQKITSLEVKFGVLELPEVGRCTYAAEKRPVIVIDKEYWFNSTEDSKEVLMLHELGHCILFRNHVEVKQGEIPSSLMNPSMITLYYKRDKEKYRKELFSGNVSTFNLTSSNTRCHSDHGG